MSNKTYKSLLIASWALTVIAMVSMVASGMWNPLPGRDRPKPPPATLPAAPPPLPIEQQRPLGQVPEFTLIDQDGKPFTDQTLKGRVWVAEFVFTRCAGPCPMMMERMAQVQKAVAGTDVHLVSFTVDPTHDTPEVLREYAKTYGADPKQWTLATGKPEEIEALSRAMLSAIRMSHDREQIMHSERFFLVDGAGNIRGPYTGTDDDGWRALSADARRLAGLGK
jgi:cytochrome oxidase Cu insertion factor (SCO1/SenC/PrrC family)